MTKIIYRIIALLICAGVICYALVLEEHEINSFVAAPKYEGGGAYLESVEKTSLMRSPVDNRLFDSDSLVPESAQLKDCKT